ncbi:MAG: hypothetical protein Q9171_000398 [Xanthocarpia ochracea]
MSTTPSTTPPLDLIVRFALSIPDLYITILSPTTTTPVTLLHQHIRPHLPPVYRSSAIRLIASGALLPPSKPLSASLRLQPHSALPPSSKGKEKQTPASAPIYIHCSITTTLTLSASALALEASSSLSTSTSPSPISSTPVIQKPPPPQNAIPNPNLQVHPGFDRLLTAGLSPSEIASLRSQFLALTAHTHTPDTMPSPSAMRRLEDRWLDTSGPASSSNTANALEGASGTTGGDDDDDDDDDDGRGALEDILWGNLMGFFWPVGAAMWLVREQGIWSKRRQVAVGTGFLVNLAIGVMKMGSG